MTYGEIGAMRRTWRDRRMRFVKNIEMLKQKVLLMAYLRFCLPQHLSAEELARRREELKKHSKPCKMSRFRGSA